MSHLFCLYIRKKFTKSFLYQIQPYFGLSGNESCPQPQTSEHLAAIEIMKLKHILILQNKIDLVKEGQAKEQQEQIVKFVQGTVAEGAPIIPISAQLKYNIEVRTCFVAFENCFDNIFYV